MTVFVTYAGLFYGHFVENLAQALVFVAVNLGGLEIASLQMILIIKAILIFKPEWLSNSTDTEVLNYTRMVSVTYATIRFWVDFLPPAKATFGTKLLTGKPLET